MGARIAVFCSGNGSNLQALIRAQRRGMLGAEIAVVFSDVVDAYALVRARKASIPVVFADPADYAGRDDYEKFLLRRLRTDRIDYVVLAGFMRILGPRFVRRYRHRIINIHPALLPAFPGRCGIADALRYGAKVTGVTVHFVDERIDHGPIILQAPMTVRADDTEQSLAERIHRVEHRLFPQAVRLLVCRKLTVNGRKVRIDHE